MSGDALVIGGGLAGAAAAIGLAEAGARVTLVERASGPHDKVCGAFLSGEAVALLDRLGVGDVLAAAPAIDRLALESGGRRARADLPFTARGLSRLVLDEALLARAEALGVGILRGERVEGIDADGTRRLVRLSGGRTLAAPHVVLATGKHDLRGHPRPLADADPMVGIKQTFAPSAAGREALAGTIALALFEGGYAGLQMVEGGRANLCLAMRESRLRAAGGPTGIVAAAIRESVLLAQAIGDAAPIDARPLAVARVPYGYVRRAGVADGVYAVGDQAGVIPSFCGDGMAIALHSGLGAARAVATGERAGTHAARLAAEIGPQIGRARLMETFAAGPLARHALVAILERAPALTRAAARLTRVPEHAWRGWLAPNAMRR